MRGLRAIAAAHDADVAELVTAAADLATEPMAPGEPRGTSAFVAVRGDAVIHKRVKVSPVSGRIGSVLAHAVNGDPDRAVAQVLAAVTLSDPKRPDYLLRGSGGMLVAITGELSDVMRSQVRTGSAQLLSDYDIDLYMQGELS